jgi:glycosyltransferase involved in cell wall biosynthesis
MRKIIVIDGVIFGLQKAGGISRLWAQTLLKLDQTIGLENDLCILLPKNQNVEWTLIAPLLKNAKIFKRKRFKWGKRGFLAERLYLTSLAGLLKADIWHATYYTAFPLFFRGKKIISFYDMIGEKLGLSTPYETKMKYQTLKAADLIISISESSKKDLNEFWPNFTQKTTVIHCFVEITPMSPPKKSAPYFLFVGKRREYKNFLTTAKSLLADSRFNEYTIKAIGGEEPLSAEERALGSRVEFLGVTPFSKVEEAMKNAALVLFPSLYEGFGIPLVEAFNYQVPVVAMRTSSIPEVLGEEYPMANPHDPASVAEVSFQLHTQREEWIAYGNERKKLFSLEAAINKLMKTYALFDHHHHI